MKESSKSGRTIMALRRGQVVPEWALLILALAVVGGICIPLWQLTAQDPSARSFTPERVARMLLGPEQIASYACFVWACLILLSRSFELRRQQRAFRLDLLPTDEGIRILPEDARPLARRVQHLSERGGPYLLSNMIRLALGRFAISHSPQDASETVRTQADVDLGRMATSMATVHYLVWAIPALGFLGTVRGIGMALTVTPDLSEESLKPFLDVTTRSLAVAFDTTLVALVLSLVLMYLLHTVQRGEETLVFDNQQYCLEHLISRLYRLEGPPPESALGAASEGEFGGEKAWPT